MLNPTNSKIISKKEYKRYAKQLIVKEIQIQGQQRLKQSKIFCIGAGGLNSSVLLHLTACGIGTIGLIDQDRIELSNLQRQIIYQTNHIGEKKVKIAFQVLKKLNPNVQINIYDQQLNTSNIKSLLSNYDIVIDGTDNFETRYLISQYCYILHKIHIYGAIDKFIGQVSIFNYQGSKHYYELHSRMSKRRFNNCNTRGLVNTLATFIGTIQATEAIKMITGVGSILSEELVEYNLFSHSFKKKKIRKNKVQKKIIVRSTKIGGSINVNFEDLEKSKTYLLVDIRNVFEFQIRSFNKSINIPLNLLKTQVFIERLRQAQIYKIVIYCNNSKRSYLASKILQRYRIKHYILASSSRKERDSNPR